MRANQFATQIGETNTNYAQSRSLSGTVLSLELIRAWSGLLLRIVLKLRTDSQFRAESRGAFPNKQSDTKKYACTGSHRQTRSAWSVFFATGSWLLLGLLVRDLLWGLELRADLGLVRVACE